MIKNIVMVIMLIIISAATAKSQSEVVVKNATKEERKGVIEKSWAIDSLARLVFQLAREKKLCQSGIDSSTSTVRNYLVYKSKSESKISIYVYSTFMDIYKNGKRFRIRMMDDHDKNSLWVSDMATVKKNQMPNTSCLVHNSDFCLLKNNFKEFNDGKVILTKELFFRELNSLMEGLEKELSQLN